MSCCRTQALSIKIMFDCLNFKEAACIGALVMALVMAFGAAILVGRSRVSNLKRELAESKEQYHELSLTRAREPARDEEPPIRLVYVTPMGLQQDNWDAGRRALSTTTPSGPRRLIRAPSPAQGVANQREDQLREFARERLEFERGARVTRRDLLETFNAWKRSMGLRIPTRDLFEFMRRMHGPPDWENIRIRREAGSEDEAEAEFSAR